MYRYVDVTALVPNATGKSKLRCINTVVITFVYVYRGAQMRRGTPKHACLQIVLAWSRPDPILKLFYLYYIVFCIILEDLPITGVRNTIARHPIIFMVPTLRQNLSYFSSYDEINFQPRIQIIWRRRPTSCCQIQPGLRCCTASVRRRVDLVVWNPVVR
jgi:hypothetical protein